MTDHNRRAGVSKYPVEAGHVIRLKEKRVLYNKRTDPERWSPSSKKEKRKHTVFIWVMRIEACKAGIQPKYRKVRLLMYYLPDKPFGHDHFKMEDIKVQFEYLTKMMRKGYKVVAKDIIYRDDQTSVGRFYQVTGAL